MATQKEILGAQPTDGNWQEVRRRRPYPANWRHSTPTLPSAKPYVPYANPSYAQIVRNPPSTAISHRQPQNPPPNSQPSSPATTTTTNFYVSPHSPSRLRFPPSHNFPKWRGRCFRCCRTGHSAAKCRNPKRCGRCWAFGHIGSKCKEDIVAPPPPIKTKPVMKKSEPGFEELLNGSLPYRAPDMPSERPSSLHCFLERDQEYFDELDRLRQAVIMHTRGYQGDLSVDNATIFACRTNLVKKEEIQVSQMSGSRFLIMLPEGLDPDTFINATSQDLWDEGITFQPWSPLDDASISIPAYKVLLRLVGLQPHISREKHVRQAVARFGVFLGSVESEDTSSIDSWLVAVGVDDLTLVPPQLVVHIGGLMYYLTVYTEAWHRAPIYTADEMPNHPKVYKGPQPPPPSSPSSDDGNLMDENELIPMSTRVLRELCNGRPADSLPPELRRFATIEVIDMETTCMPTQEGATLDPEQDNKENQTGMILSQNALMVSNRLDDPLHHGQKDTCVVGLQTAPNTSIHEVRSTNGRRQSLQNDLQSSMPQEPAGSISKISDPIIVKDMAGHKPSRHNPIDTQQRRIQPQKILLRGESSARPVNPISEVQNLRQMPSIRLIDIAAVTEKARTSIPLNLEDIQERYGASEVIQKKNSRPRGKGPACSLKMPLSANYKLKRPISKKHDKGLKKVKEQMGLKRKNQHLPSSAAPSKKLMGKGKSKEEKAEVSFNAEGFYEVQVQYDHMAKLATGCGFRREDVINAVNIDNEHRRELAAVQNIESNQADEESPDLDMGRFDPSSGDEMTSEEEG